MGHKSNERQLGLSDVIAGAILFFLLSLLLKALMDSAVPGLLKDDTLLQVQISGVMFLLFWAAMGNFLFKPYLDLVIERENKTKGYEKAVGEHVESAHSLEKEVAVQLQECRLSAIKERDKVTEQARKDAQQILNQALTEAEAKREKAQLEIENVRDRALAEVSGEAEQLASLVIERALS